MSAAEDLRELALTLETIAHGGLPRWGLPSTQLGAAAQTAALAMYEQWRTSRVSMRGMEMAREAESAQRAVIEKLTEENERLVRIIEQLTTRG